MGVVPESTAPTVGRSSRRLADYHDRGQPAEFL